VPSGRAAALTDTDAYRLGEALGRKYVERHFPPEAKARMKELVKNLLLAMGDTIRGLDRMGPQTKAKALETLATFNPKVSYPDRRKDYSKVEVARGTFWADVVAALRWNVADDRAQVGKLVNRGRWEMTPPTSNAYLQPAAQRARLPPGHPAAARVQVRGDRRRELWRDRGRDRARDQPQLRRPGRAARRNRAPRELVDPGRPRELPAAHAARRRQFDKHEVEPGLHHNGNLVLGEAIGDLAGAKIAYRAFLKSLEGRAQAPAIDGFTPEQQFFVAWGQSRGDAIRPETQRLMVQGAPQALRGLVAACRVAPVRLSSAHLHTGAAYGYPRLAHSKVVHTSHVM